jgi:hypothetical protein
MKSVEQKKESKRPKYIRNPELEKHINSKEIKDLVRQLEIIEKNKEKLHDTSL